jgi:hypothetical protein
VTPILVDAWTYGNEVVLSHASDGRISRGERGACRWLAPATAECPRERSSRGARRPRFP